jgi:hypothetical protein
VPLQYEYKNMDPKAYLFRLQGDLRPYFQLPTQQGGNPLTFRQQFQVRSMHPLLLQQMVLYP